jgi:prepilin-type processing-associated H-X9-DG protein
MGVSEINQGENGPTFRGCPRGPYAYRAGNPKSLCSTFHFWSLHAGGANFAFADGSVRFLRYEAAPVMPALATRAGDDVATLPD